VTSARVDMDRRAGTDPVQLAVVINRLRAIVLKMSNTLYRTGRSGVLNAARDFSCCIVSHHHELLMAADSLPIHVMSGPDLMSRSVAELHPSLQRGDAFLHNSPYHGNSHAADHCVLVPVIDEAGVHRHTLVVKAHQADCGNSAPSTYMGAATDVYAEGALIFPAVKVQEDYRDREDILRMCELRIRVPEQWRGDYLAMVGAARIGERELLALGAELGWDTLHQIESDWLDYSEARMVAALRELPSGTVTAGTTHDPFPGAPDGIPIRVVISVDSADATVHIDLRDNPDTLSNGLNLTEATARTAALVGLFNGMHRAVPPNAGSFRRVEVGLREDCAVGIPRHPASCSVATTNLADRVSNAVQRALASLGDGFGLAECGPVIPASAAVISGVDPRTNAPFVNQVIFALTGGAGGPVQDGWLTIGHVGNGGLLYRDSVEMDELHYPIRVESQRLLVDTEGAGRLRGAPSAEVEFGPVDTDMHVLYGADGTFNPARGARGGASGGPARHLRRGSDGELTELEPLADVALKSGETIVATTTGGGGYGPPWERDVSRVLADVNEGLVTRDRAASVYGVVVTADGDVDVGQTVRVREGMRDAAGS
jgi:N-methylhydantoinase B